MKGESLKPRTESREMSKTNKRKHCLTFRGILEEVAPKNARKLMQRAQAANRLAKSLRGRSRARAYAVKTRAVRRLAKRFPNRVRIVVDITTPGFVLVRVPQVNFGLHVPANLLIPAYTKASSLQWHARGDSAKIGASNHPGFGVIRSPMRLAST